MDDGFLKRPAKYLRWLCENEQTTGLLQMMAARHPTVFRAAVQHNDAAVFRQCCHQGKADAARVLAPYVADVFARNGEALLVACRDGSDKIIRLLLERGNWRPYAQAAVAEVIRYNRPYLLKLFDCSFTLEVFLSVLNDYDTEPCNHVWNHFVAKPAPMPGAVRWHGLYREWARCSPSLAVWMLKSYLLTDCKQAVNICKYVLQSIPAAWDEAACVIIDAHPRLVTERPTFEPAYRWHVRRAWIISVVS